MARNSSVSMDVVDVRTRPVYFQQSRNQDASVDQDEIKRQIAALQARLLSSPKRVGTQPAENSTGPGKRVLVARSPSPKRRKIQHDPQTKPQTKQSNKAANTSSKPVVAPAFKPPSPPRKSAVAAAASAFQTNRAGRLKDEKEPVVRSTSFAQPLPVERPAPIRNDDLTVKEDLPLGPIDHPAPRISEVCEYHIQDAIKSKRAARPEFSAGTADYSASNPRTGKGGKFGKPAYDPSRKWGLTPSASQSAGPNGGATYVVNGRVFSGFDSGGFNADTTRLKQVNKRQEEEMALEELIRRDGGKTPAAQILKKGAAHLKSLKSTGASTSANDGPDEQPNTADEGAKKVYSADLVKSIGFDPSRRSANNGRPKEGEGMRQLVANLDRSITLGPARGTKRVRSNVTTKFAPSREKEPETSEKAPEAKVPEPTSDSDSELEIEF
ncbi:unnamed protein product [Rhizoctonia solani]|uniref:Uncharacterized protein n=1 Tax=Rhizoctonia solani TaxID=456999 RepID=A0A8H3D8J5_9AGAM|nr:unnamed protein product [Rhizoctonia solani]